MKRERRGAGWERAAAMYLEEHGATVRELNYAVLGGEIDIICEMDGFLVFCEVKQRFNARYGTAAEAVDAGKRRRIRRTAAEYLRGQRNRLPVRFDVIEITEEGLRHKKGAFADA